MMVTFVSQCQKKALNRTRRVLDAFANRIGDNTWQTIITQEGLQAVKKLLRKTATKNTAVSCHWIRSRSRSELIWVVGNRGKFDLQGLVPVNVTMESKQVKERFSLNTDVIALLSGLAGLFHDVGKANELFQNKLNGNSEKTYECYRHEWVSLRVFQAFVDERDDREWLEELANIDNKSEKKVLERLSNLKDGITDDLAPVFKELNPVARLVAWLIVSHHKLPVYPKDLENKPGLDKANEWEESIFEAIWNSSQALKTDWSVDEIEKNWHFPYGTPLQSVHWQTQVSLLARKILRHERVFLQSWMEQRYTAHLARLSLMLADHYYSSDEPDIKISRQWQDRNYRAYANTFKNEHGQKQLKQKLDEHNIAVSLYSGKIAKQLSNLRDDLPVLISKKLNQPTKNGDFIWQNKAYDLSRKIREETKKYGFFGICKASTGKGKTLGNARIMYGLSDDETCRFNIALGLRTLTLQTAKALGKDLELKQEQIATLIGSQVVKELHQAQAEESISQQEQHGSLSSEPLLKDDIEVLGGVNDYTGDFEKWIEHDPKIKKLIQAPLLVSTIDYLIPATEGIRGGRQIAPMLRLLSSDLVLDEPDDFGLEDLPALCRLVNWAGMLGSRVLLSTATMPPSLASALFSAYQAGRKQYTEVNGEQGINDTVCCAWFDEFKQPKSLLINNQQDFELSHKQFVDERIVNLTKVVSPLRKAKLIDIGLNKDLTQKPTEWMASNIQQSISELHQQHALNLLGKHISIGLVRFANIDPLVQVSKHLLNKTPESNTIIHYCIYHGQFPLIQRSTIEKQLDVALNRKDEDHWVKHSGLAEIVNDYQEMEHIFVVLATSVAEVGRDHDYDWAIIEPSSMRSIIQLAGRIQRHRKIEPKSKNMHILSTNYKGLKKQCPNFIKPGFETKNIQLASNNLFELDVEKQIETISAIPRIQTLDNPKTYLTDTQPRRINSFNALEHLSQSAKLFGSKSEKSHASLWWKTDASWCGELQARQPFRQSALDDDYCLFQPSHASELRWHEKVPKTYPAKYQLTEDIAYKPDVLSLASGVAFWIDVDFEKEIEKWLDKYGGHPEQTAKKLTHISLRKLSSSTEEQWQWHSYLGVYKRLKKDKWSDDE